MNAEQFLRVFNLLLFVGSLLFVYRHVYKRARLSCFRERLFQLRDELFDHYAVNHLPFESKAYGQMRSLLNAFILQAEFVTVFRLLVLSYEIQFVRIEPQTRATAWKQLPEGELREYYERLNNELFETILKHISPFSSLKLTVMTSKLLVAFLNLRAGYRRLTKDLLRDSFAAEVEAFQPASGDTRLLNRLAA